MAQQITPTPGPWKPVWTPAGVILIVATVGDRMVTIAAVDGGDKAEANAEAICLVPDLLLTIRAGDLTAARQAIAARGLA